jgi:hypothetical protein
VNCRDTGRVRESDDGDDGGDDGDDNDDDDDDDDDVGSPIIRHSLVSSICLVYVEYE